jgi:hypothetical protein
MNKKMGRPPLPEGRSKDIQVGARFNPAEGGAVEAKAIEHKVTKSEFVRRAAVEATKEWIQLDPWSLEDLHGKRVEFELVLDIEGPIKGTGRFDVWKNGEGLCKIVVRTYDDKSTDFETHELRIYVPQKGVEFIKKLPPGSACDFSVKDPLFEKYVQGD